MSDASQLGFSDVFGDGRGQVASRELAALTVTNRDDGHSFTFRIVYEGDRYGRDGCLTHNQREPLVEAYDAHYAGDERFDELGQFTGGRWYLRTLLECTDPQGLIMDAGVPVWRIDGPAHRQLLAWLEQARW